MANRPKEGQPLHLVLDSFRVRRFRSLKDLEMRFEPDVTVIVGRNDTGKSSILEALRQYGQIAATGFRIAAQTGRSSETVGASFQAVWRDIETGAAYEHKVFSHPMRPRESLQGPHLACTWDPRSRTLRCGRKAYEGAGLPRLSSLGSVSPSEWRIETEVPDDLSASLAVLRDLAVPTPYLLEPSMLALEVPVDFETMSKNGAGWANVLQDVINRRDGTLERLESTVHALFPFFRRVTLVEQRWQWVGRVVGLDDRVTDPVVSVHGGRGRRSAADEPYQAERALRFEVESPAAGTGRPKRTWVAAEAMSSGLLLAAAYLTVVYGAPPGSLLALEEPENGLNRVITLAMMEQFLEVVRQRKHQLIMTTHNEYWLDLVGPDRVRVVTRDEGGSHVWAAPDNMRKLREEGFALSEVMAVGGPEQLIEERRSRP